MPPVDETIHDLAVKHRIGLNRYSTMTVHKVIAQLNRIERDVISRLSQFDGSAFARQRLEQLLAELQAIQVQGWQVVAERTNQAVNDLAAHEITFADRLAKIAGGAESANTVFTGAPALPQVIAAVNARPFQGRFLREWLAEAGDSAAKRVRDTIRQGFIEGQTTDQIVRTLRGTRAMQYKDGVLEGTRRGVEAMVRTALTHTANVAQDEVFKANADVIVALIWTSTLDNRTTLICASRSENEYPLDSGPRPPAHINCRSVMRPKIAPIPGVAPYKAPTYAEWFARQPAAVQDDILGPTRAKLYRQGGLTVDRFVDRAGQTLTLDELRARDASAFEKAGL